MTSRRASPYRLSAAALLPVLVLVLAGCGTGRGSDEQPRAGADGRVPATPRALAAVVIGHVEPGDPRRSTGEWSDWGDPLTIGAQVDYGVDPEGTEDGETRTVRVEVADPAVYAAHAAVDREWWRCRPAREEGRCEQERVEGGTLLYRWSPGAEEEEAGTYVWTVVREAEVVHVSYEGSGLFAADPRTLGLEVDPDDLRAAALDPALGLRTTPAAHAAGTDLDHYEGEERPPEEPQVTRTTPRQLAARLSDQLGLRPASVRRSGLPDFGLDAVRARLEFAPTRRHQAFALDVLTTTGRVPQIDPLPCRVQDPRGAAANACFAWGRDAAATWTLATADRPGTLWVIGAHDDEAFNRVESVGVRVTSKAIDAPYFTDPALPDGLPETLLGDLYGFVADLSVGPEQQRTGP